MHIEDYVNLQKGGKSAPPPPPAPTPIAPTAPVEEASLEMDNNKDKKLRTGKASLKVPLSQPKSSGLNL